MRRDQREGTIFLLRPGSRRALLAAAAGREEVPAQRRGGEDYIAPMD
jgi:hypothetical protein